jgi:hypothetical protein
MREMKTSLGEEFVNTLMSSLPSPEARLRAGAVLMQFEGCSLYLPTSNKAARRIQAATQMLKNGLSPAEAATALRERFRITARTAQRDVANARKMSPSNV